MTCTEAGARGHLLWHLNADQLAEGIKTIHFQYLSCETQQSLAVSEPVYLDELFRHRSLREEELNKSAKIDAVNEENPAPSAEAEEESATLDRPLLSDDHHHYSPLWM